jgi:hypothetical protein
VEKLSVGRRSCGVERFCEFGESGVFAVVDGNQELNIGNGKSHNVPITSALSDMFHIYIRNFYSFEKQKRIKSLFLVDSYQVLRLGKYCHS